MQKVWTASFLYAEKMGEIIYRPSPDGSFNDSLMNYDFTASMEQSWTKSQKVKQAHGRRSPGLTSSQTLLAT